MEVDLKNVGRGEINLTNPPQTATVLAQDRNTMVFLFNNIIYQCFEDLHDLLYFRGTINFATVDDLWELDFTNGKWFDATPAHLEHVSFIEHFEEPDTETIIVD